MISIDILVSCYNHLIEGDFFLRVYDVAGKKIWDHRVENVKSDSHHIKWNFTTGIRNGLYLVSLVQNEKVVVKKFSLVK